MFLINIREDAGRRKYGRSPRRFVCMHLVFLLRTEAVDTSSPLGRPAPGATGQANDAVTHLIVQSIFLSGSPSLPYSTRGPNHIVLTLWQRTSNQG